LWLSTSDGARQVQITSRGGYSDASQADDGTLIALNGLRLHSLDRAGNVLADFDTPVSDTRPPGSREFFGPFEPAVSPDGTTVVYSWYHVEISQRPDCFPPQCVTRDMRQGVGYSHADRQTAWDELGRMTGWVHPAWSEWFTDYSTRHVAGGDVTPQGTTLALVTGETENEMRVYRMRGAPPELRRGRRTAAGWPGPRATACEWSRSPTSRPHARPRAPRPPPRC
jgi:hypothetical protein